jgi:hypothetical protein
MFQKFPNFYVVQDASISVKLLTGLGRLVVKGWYKKEALELAPQNEITLVSVWRHGRGTSVTR